MIRRHRRGWAALLSALIVLGLLPMHPAALVLAADPSFSPSAQPYQAGHSATPAELQAAQTELDLPEGTTYYPETSPIMTRVPACAMLWGTDLFPVAIDSRADIYGSCGGSITWQLTGPAPSRSSRSTTATPR